MKITDTALRRPVTVLIITLSMIFFGLFVLKGMGVQRIPDIDFPMVTVTTTMQGASATVMDHDVTDVIEEKLSSISGIDSLYSYSYEGMAVTLVQFDLGKDVDAAAADVRDKVSLAVADLPEEAETPVVAKYTIGDESLVTVAVMGPASYSEKAAFADKIAKPRFQSVDGVGNVETPGLREREIRVWLDPAHLEARGLTLSDISTAIRNKHVELPAGSIENANREVQLRLTGEYDSVESLKSLPITAKNGGIVRLGDVARVEDGLEERRSVATYNGRETILIGVGKQRGANEVQVADAIVRQLDRLKAEAPSGIELKVIYNGADFVRRSIGGAFQNVLQAIALCSLIMLFFLRTFRATFVAIVTIPVCLLGSLIILKGIGLTLNALTMMGISLAVGMVVDATTVVLDNVHRHMERGMPAMQASSIGTGEVAFSVLGGATTTMAVFAPVAFMGGIVGRFFYSFGITVVCTIALSLAFSLTLTPFLCSRIMQKDKPGRVALAIEGFLDGLEKGYRALLAKAVSLRWLTLGIAVGLFVFGLVIASRIGTGFFPSDDQGTFSIEVEMPSGTSIEATERTLMKMDKVVRADQDVEYTYAQIGTGMGREVNKGTLYVDLIPRSERPEVKTVMNRLRHALSGFREARISLGTRGGADIELSLVGGTPEELVKIADKALAVLGKDPRLTDLNTDVRLEKPLLDLELNRGRTDDMNLNVRDLSTEVQGYFGGTKAGVFKEGGYRYDIRLMAERDLRKEAPSVEQIAVRNASGQIVRIPGLVSTKPVMSPNAINRYGRQTSLSITANVAKGFSSGEALALVKETFGKFLPADGRIKIQATGFSKTQEEDFGRLFVALAVAIVLVYVVMAIQFESFLHPFTVMFALPLLTPGAFGLLYLAGNNLDMMSFIGLILLVGTVVNNAIVLVDFINQERAKGNGKVKAVLNAGPLRLRAILMSAVSNVVGSIPVALMLAEGAELRQPMAVAMIGGFFTATPLTLLVIPVIYLVMDDARDKVRAFARWLRSKFARQGVRATVQQMIPGGE
jgi:HAE1 family hydrophobic/amphiphilic exporter-1